MRKMKRKTQIFSHPLFAKHILLNAIHTWTLERIVGIVKRHRVGERHFELCAGGGRCFWRAPPDSPILRRRTVGARPHPNRNSAQDVGPSARQVAAGEADARAGARGSPSGRAAGRREPEGAPRRVALVEIFVLYSFLLLKRGWTRVALSFGHAHQRSTVMKRRIERRQHHIAVWHAIYMNLRIAFQFFLSFFFCYPPYLSRFVLLSSSRLITPFSFSFYLLRYSSSPS